MSNGNELSKELAFEEQIKSFSTEGKFLARQLYETCEKLAGHEGRITSIEGANRKMFGVSGGIGGVAAGIAIAIIDYFAGGQK